MTLFRGEPASYQGLRLHTVNPARANGIPVGKQEAAYKSTPYEDRSCLDSDLKESSDQVLLSLWTSTRV